MHSRQFQNQFVNVSITLVSWLQKVNAFQDFSLIWQHSFSVASIVINCLLIFILKTSKMRGLGSYHYLLTFFSTFDIYFTIIHWLVYPIPEMYENSVLVRGHGIFNSRPGPSIYIAAYQTALPILASSFLYRKLAITSLFINYVILAPDDINVPALAPLFEGNVSSPLFHRNGSAKDCLIAQYWASEVDTFSKPRWRTFIGVSIAASFSLVAYVVILHCGFVIHAFLKNNATSQRSMKLHRQLFLSLVFQAIYPLIFNYFPIWVCLVLPIFGISQSWASIPIPLCCASHPLLDPIFVIREAEGRASLFVIICTTDFRKAFVRYLSVCRNSRTDAPSSMSLSKGTPVLNFSKH